MYTTKFSILLCSFLLHPIFHYASDKNNFSHSQAENDSMRPQDCSSFRARTLILLKLLQNDEQYLSTHDKKITMDLKFQFREILHDIARLEAGKSLELQENIITHHQKTLNSMHETIKLLVNKDQQMYLTLMLAEIDFELDEYKN